MCFVRPLRVRRQQHLAAVVALASSAGNLRGPSTVLSLVRAVSLVTGRHLTASEYFSRYQVSCSSEGRGSDCYLQRQVTKRGLVNLLFAQDAVVAPDASVPARWPLVEGSSRMN